MTETSLDSDDRLDGGSELEQLRTRLEAIPPTQLRPPGMPIAVALQEANNLRVVLRRGDTRSRLVAVGVEPEVVDELSRALAATRRAQSQWVVARDRNKPRAQAEREAAGLRLRTELLAACRWNLRTHAQARAVLDRVRAGRGTPDLVQDLSDLATLVDHHRPAFERDASFDAPTQAEAARSLATQITVGLSTARSARHRDQLKLTRDRAYTHLAGLVTHLREAGRYAFRNEPERAAAFASDHRRARERKRRRASTRGPAGSTADTRG